MPVVAAICARDRGSFARDGVIAVKGIGQSASSMVLCCRVIRGYSIWAMTANRGTWLSLDFARAYTKADLDRSGLGDR